jgi:hypothetical protein
LSSVLDEVRTVQEHIVSRLAELRPLVAEYQELERLAKQMDVDPAALQVPAILAPAAQRAAAPRSAKRSAAKAKAKPRASTKREAAATRKPAAKPKARAKAAATAPSPLGTREKGAQRRQQILDLIRTRPGITVPDLSGVLGVDPPPLYRVVRKLQADGIVTKNGKELRLA